MLKDYERYGVAVGQVYVPADRSKNRLVVVDVKTHEDCGDVVVYDEVQATQRRIDAFKLARARYCLEEAMPVTRSETVYVHPGQSQCRVYAMPYALRPGQSPSDILPQYQAQWLEIALLNYQLKIVYLHPAYADLREDIEGQMGGTTFTVERPLPTVAEPSAALGKG